MKKKIIPLAASILLVNFAYASDDAANAMNNNSEASKAEVHTHITDFELISEGSSSDCDKFFGQALKEKTLLGKKDNRQFYPAVIPLVIKNAS